MVKVFSKINYHVKSGFRHGFKNVIFSKFFFGFVASLSMIISSHDKAGRIKDNLDARFNEQEDTFDFIVVGGGSAGSIVANRLSENHKVLLLEAGGEPHPLQRIPGMAFFILNHKETDWMHRTVPQRRACFASPHRRSGWSQGRNLGGSGNLNFMVHLRGSPRDYDYWAKITGDESWSYAGVLPYFRRHENYQGDSPDRDAHGFDGELKLEVPSYTGMAKEFIRAGQELGYEHVDLNARYEEGFDTIYCPLEGGERRSSFAAFLDPIRERETLIIRKYAHVNKILIRGFDNTAFGVEYDRHGLRRYAYATKEIIVSAGTVESAKLLMLSGVGPKTHLADLGIPAIANLPVGKNLQDHLATFLGPFFIDPPRSYLIDRDITLKSFYEYKADGNGPLSSSLFQAAAMISSKQAKHAGIWNWPDIQLLLSGMGGHKTFARDMAHAFHLNHKTLKKYYEHSLGRDSFFIAVAASRPMGRGEIVLEKKDPYSHPSINPRYLENDHDMHIMIEGIKTALYLVENTTSFQNLRARFTSKKFPGCEHMPFRSDDYFECYVRHLSVSLHDPVGTCAMGHPHMGKDGVLDSQLQVIGVNHLRVIDASVMPTIVGSGTESAVMMIAEKGADMIMEAWKTRDTGGSTPPPFVPSSHVHGPGHHGGPPPYGPPPGGHGEGDGPPPFESHPGHDPSYTEFDPAKGFPGESGSHSDGPGGGGGNIPSTGPGPGGFQNYGPPSQSVLPPDPPQFTVDGPEEHYGPPLDSFDGPNGSNDNGFSDGPGSSVSISGPPSDSFNGPPTGNNNNNNNGPPGNNYGPPSKNNNGPSENNYGPPSQNNNGQSGNNYGPPSQGNIGPNYGAPGNNNGPPGNNNGPPGNNNGPPGNNNGPPGNNNGPHGNNNGLSGNNNGPPANNYGPPSQNNNGHAQDGFTGPPPPQNNNGQPGNNYGPPSQNNNGHAQDGFTGPPPLPPNNGQQGNFNSGPQNNFNNNNGNNFNNNGPQGNFNNNNNNGPPQSNGFGPIQNGPMSNTESPIPDSTLQPPGFPNNDGKGQIDPRFNPQDNEVSTTETTTSIILPFGSDPPEENSPMQQNQHHQTMMHMDHMAESSTNLPTTSMLNFDDSTTSESSTVASTSTSTLNPNVPLPLAYDSFKLTKFDDNNNSSSGSGSVPSASRPEVTLLTHDTKMRPGVQISNPFPDMYYANLASEQENQHKEFRLKYPITSTVEYPNKIPSPPELGPVYFRNPEYTTRTPVLFGNATRDSRGSGDPPGYNASVTAAARIVALTNVPEYRPYNDKGRRPNEGTVNPHVVYKSAGVSNHVPSTANVPDIYYKMKDQSSMDAASKSESASVVNVITAAAVPTPSSPYWSNPSPMPRFLDHSRGNNENNFNNNGPGASSTSNPNPYWTSLTTPAGQQNQPWTPMAQIQQNGLRGSQTGFQVPENDLRGFENNFQNSQTDFQNSQNNFRANNGFEQPNDLRATTYQNPYDTTEGFNNRRPKSPRDFPTEGSFSTPSSTLTPPTTTETTTILTTTTTQRPLTTTGRPIGRIVRIKSGSSYSTTPAPLAGAESLTSTPTDPTRAPAMFKIKIKHKNTPLQGNPEAEGKIQPYFSQGDRGNSLPTPRIKSKGQKGLKAQMPFEGFGNYPVTITPRPLLSVTIWPDDLAKHSGEHPVSRSKLKARNSSSLVGGANSNKFVAAEGFSKEYREGLRHKDFLENQQTKEPEVPKKGQFTANEPQPQGTLLISSLAGAMLEAFGANSGESYASDNDNEDHHDNNNYNAGNLRNPTDEHDHFGIPDSDNSDTHNLPHRLPKTTRRPFTHRPTQQTIIQTDVEYVDNPNGFAPQVPEFYAQDSPNAFVRPPYHIDQNDPGTFTNNRYRGQEASSTTKFPPWKPSLRLTTPKEPLLSGGVTQRPSSFTNLIKNRYNNNNNNNGIDQRFPTSYKEVPPHSVDVTTPSNDVNSSPIYYDESPLKFGEPTLGNVFEQSTTTSRPRVNRGRYRRPNGLGQSQGQGGQNGFDGSGSTPSPNFETNLHSPFKGNQNHFSFNQNQEENRFQLGNSQGGNSQGFGANVESSNGNGHFNNGEGNQNFAQDNFNYDGNNNGNNFASNSQSQSQNYEQSSNNGQFGTNQEQYPNFDNTFISSARPEVNFNSGSQFQQDSNSNLNNDAQNINNFNSNSNNGAQNNFGQNTNNFGQNFGQNSASNFNSGSSSATFNDFQNSNQFSQSGNAASVNNQGQNFNEGSSGFDNGVGQAGTFQSGSQSFDQGNFNLNDRVPEFLGEEKPPVNAVNSGIDTGKVSLTYDDTGSISLLDQPVVKNPDDPKANVAGSNIDISQISLTSSENGGQNGHEHDQSHFDPTLHQGRGVSSNFEGQQPLFDVNQQNNFGNQQAHFDGNQQSNFDGGQHGQIQNTPHVNEAQQHGQFDPGHQNINHPEIPTEFKTLPQNPNLPTANIHGHFDGLLTHTEGPSSTLGTTQRPLVFGSRLNRERNRDPFSDFGDALQSPRVQNTPTGFSEPAQNNPNGFSEPIQNNFNFGEQPSNFPNNQPQQEQNNGGQQLDFGRDSNIPPVRFGSEVFGSSNFGRGGPGPSDPNININTNNGQGSSPVPFSPTPPSGTKQYTIFSDPDSVEITQDYPNRFNHLRRRADILQQRRRKRRRNFFRAITGGSGKDEDKETPPPFRRRPRRPHSRRRHRFEIENYPFGDDQSKAQRRSSSVEVEEEEGASSSEGMFSDEEVAKSRDIIKSLAGMDDPIIHEIMKNSTRLGKATYREGRGMQITPRPMSTFSNRMGTSPRTEAPGKVEELKQQIASVKLKMRLGPRKIQGLVAPNGNQQLKPAIEKKQLVPVSQEQLVLKNVQTSNPENVKNLVPKSTQQQTIPNLLQTVVPKSQEQQLVPLVPEKPQGQLVPKLIPPLVPHNQQQNLVPKSTVPLVTQNQQQQLVPKLIPPLVPHNQQQNLVPKSTVPLVTQNQQQQLVPKLIPPLVPQNTLKQLVPKVPLEPLISQTSPTPQNSNNKLLQNSKSVETDQDKVETLPLGSSTTQPPNLQESSVKS